MTDALWPALPYDEWKDTYATLHMWMQVVGKVALAQSPPINQSWAVAFHVTGRGLSLYQLEDKPVTIRVRRQLGYELAEVAVRVRARAGAHDHPHQRRDTPPLRHERPLHGPRLLGRSQAGTAAAPPPLDSRAR